MPQGNAQLYLTASSSSSSTAVLLVGIALLNINTYNLEVHSGLVF